MSSDFDFLAALKAGYARCNCSPDDGLLLAVSGGADSMALLHGTVTLWPDRLARIAIVHVDHQLRGDESRADAGFVRDSARKLGAKFFGLTADVMRERAAHGGSIEEVARRLRYQLFQEAAEANGFRCVVCAHHQDDQAETILHNAVRGTGLRGLRGMGTSRKLSDGVNLTRPLLAVSRTDINRFVDANALEFRHDSSNSDSRLLRNRIRSRILPVLKREFHPRAAENLVSLASYAAESLDALDALGRRMLDEAMLDRQPNVCRINRVKFSTWPRVLICHALSLLWTEQNWPRQKMASRHWKSLAEGILAGSDRRVDLPGSIELVARENIVRITRMGPGATANAGGQGKNPGESEQT